MSTTDASPPAPGDPGTIVGVLPPPSTFLVALVAWPPIGLAAAAIIGDVTGCSAFAATCTGSEPLLPWLAQAAILGLLLLLPPVTRLLAGGALVFLFETAEGSLFYQDTSGHWSGILRDLRPDVAILAAAGRGNVDGDPVQGSLAGFVTRQADLLRPRRVVLSHHDDWLPGFSNAIDTKPVGDEIARQCPRAELVEMGYLEGYRLFDDL